MAQLNKTEIWQEMARRKIQFNKNKKWQEIKLWGLFYASYIKKEIAAGELLSVSDYGSRCLGWYYPSEEAYNKYIKPILKLKTNQL